MDWFLLAFTSAIFSAAAAVSEKKALFSLNVVVFSAIISVITLIMSAPFFIMMPETGSITESLIVLFIKSVMNAAAFFAVMTSIKKLDISEALPLLALSPGIVAIAGVIFIDDHLELYQWVGVILMVTGTYLLELRKGNENIFTPLKNIVVSGKYTPVMIALLLFTVSSLIDRILLRDYALPPYTFMAYQQLFFVIIFLTLFTISMMRGKTVIRDFRIGREIWGILILTSIFTVIYRYTQIEAVKLAPVALVLSVKRLSVLMAVLTGGRIFKEEFLVRRIIAAAIILLGTTILIVKNI
jgi:drug/metabolite transporter (DMT)-like permease